MFAIAALIAFALAFLLDVLDTAGDLGSTIVTLGFVFLAAHFSFGGGLPWRRNP